MPGSKIAVRVWTSRRGFTLIELLVVIGVMALLVAVLLPVLSSMRKASVRAKMASDVRQDGYAPPAAVQAPGGKAGAATQAVARRARVQSFDATVDLTPRLSVGTAEAESIYEAKLSAKLLASAEPPGGDAELSLPLPPQIISLADLSVRVGGAEAEGVSVGDGELLWRGPLPPGAPTLVELTYTAVGRGIYAVQPPPGRVIDKFSLKLAANGSDVRMLELSMQPTGLSREPGRTLYTWDYQKLMFGRPISLDVLGIAPIDRLGELSWLGPLSVILFGVLVGLVGRAFRVTEFDRWMLLLIVGTFTGTYPLMYFAQQFVPLKWAILVPAALTLQVVGWRAVTIMGPRLAAAGVVAPGAAILALTLCAAVQPQLQGILLTAGALVFFVAAMVLLPRAHDGGGAGAHARASVPATAV